MDLRAITELSRIHQFAVVIVAAVLGLGLAELTHAGTLGSIALVALVGIIIGFGLAAWQRSRQSSADDRS
jgi:hypothetical protein